MKGIIYTNAPPRPTR